MVLQQANQIKKKIKFKTIIFFLSFNLTSLKIYGKYYWEDAKKKSNKNEDYGKKFKIFTWDMDSKLIYHQWDRPLI